MAARHRRASEGGQGGGEGEAIAGNGLLQLNVVAGEMLDFTHTPASREQQAAISQCWSLASALQVLFRCFLFSTFYLFLERMLQSI